MTQDATDPDGLVAPPATTPEEALAVAVSHLPDAHPVPFTMKIRGGAYDRLEVDTFMSRLSQAITEVKSATTAVQEEVAALRAEKGKARASNAGDEEEITASAVGLLTQAQLIADKAVADAEQYARDLVLTARNQYREILERAESSASRATATLPRQQSPVVPEIEYVRTYAQVAQIQLRSVLDALTEQVDRLGAVPPPTLDPAAQHESDDGPAGEPEWQPSISGVPAPQPH
ncbi:hypothetical protein [Agromyces sp. Marseille-P2726]|uniref:hypothetical protein n=1 Tax=Agromyces sp. Marseille-P2726 TaxID=2709132 RepID=UPI00156DD02E|nr:hypothetical protein [Agromyces sp. Marseille-P2726]